MKIQIYTQHEHLTKITHTHTCRYACILKLTNNIQEHKFDLTGPTLYIFSLPPWFLTEDSFTHLLKHWTLDVLYFTGTKERKRTLIYRQGIGIQVIMGWTCTSNDRVFHVMTLSICQWQMNKMWVGSISGITLTAENLSTRREPRFSAILLINNPMWTSLRLKPGLCCERTMMNVKGMIRACLWAKFLKMHLHLTNRT